MSDELPQDTEPVADDAVSQANDFETQKHLWIQTLVPVLQARNPEKDSSDRVQFAFDMMFVAVADKIARICRSDLAQTDAPG